ncbi:(2E,6E)-farnesyl diphosphate synthase [Aurantivibrio infirmus]
MTGDFTSYLTTRQQRINQYLRSQLDDLPRIAPRLIEAMSYSLFNNGKRVRPILAYASAEALGAKLSDLPLIDKVAGALESIHTYSLIHDDLPAMDDDDLRRGLPTCHIAFDEATAILAGDGLHTLAFELLVSEANTVSDPAIVTKLVAELARASGPCGMIAGQSIDLDSVAKQLSLPQLEEMHRYKTGALIRASVLMGAIATGTTNEQQLRALESYANSIGLAFQVQDDILDVTGDAGTLGKQAGADARKEKPTYVSLLGLEQAKRKAAELHQRALSALEVFEESAEPLRTLSSYIINRDR